METYKIVIIVIIVIIVVVAVIVNFLELPLLPGGYENLRMSGRSASKLGWNKYNQRARGTLLEPRGKRKRDLIAVIILASRGRNSATRGKTWKEKKS